MSSAVAPAATPSAVDASKAPAAATASEPAARDTQEMRPATASNCARFKQMHMAGMFIAAPGGCSTLGGGARTCAGCCGFRSQQHALHDDFRFEQEGTSLETTVRLARLRTHCASCCADRNAAAAKGCSCACGGKYHCPDSVAAADMMRFRRAGAGCTESFDCTAHAVFKSIVEHFERSARTGLISPDTAPIR